jgi:heme exporter protein CcmD
MREFFDMNGYWPFVWPAYAVALGALMLNAWQARRLLDRAREEARRKLAMRESP